MTRDEIIKLAREADMDVDHAESNAWGAIITAEPADLERFAALVEERAAAQERKGWQDTVKKILVEVKKSDERYMNLFKINNELIELIQKAKSQEREECAKVAAWILKMPENDVSSAIRARGNDT